MSTAGLSSNDLKRLTKGFAGNIVKKPAVLIIVENLPVPLDRRVWQESCALRDAGYEVVVICPKMRGWTAAYECRDGIHIYRHWISEEAGGLLGFVGEYASALCGETILAWKAWWRHRFRIIHICNPPDLLFLVALPFKLFFGTRVIYDQHDLWPEMYEAKFGGRGYLYWMVRTAEWLTYWLADVVVATNQSVKKVAEARGKKKPDSVIVVRTAPKIQVQECAADNSLRRGRRYLVGYVGVMGNADGVHYLVEAVKHIVQHRKRQDIQFLLMGTGPEYETLVKLRDFYKLRDFVDMPGRVSNEYLFSALKTMDLGVACDPINPYNNHCTMNKTLEYMAFGKPQVMFATFEGRESAAEAAAYIYENCPEKLGDIILEVLRDEQRRDLMSSVALRRIIGPLAWENSVENLLSAYENVAT
ncbi:glycosyltransferase [bacterium]|nr:glycosyltransferase [bacterium]